MSDDQQDRDPNWGANVGWAIVATLISGIVFWGGVGWLIDWWLGTKFIVGIGIVLGAIGAIVLIFKKYIPNDDDNNIQP
ncbi:MAG: hypothetical protein HOQ05_07895 [Corynebacteriales bacterium]|nr:hypothetical protein [Mycobacteriales bacterium]